MTLPSDLSDRIEDYRFDLPPELIAQSPAPTREGARLLVVRREPRAGMPRFEDLLVSDLPALTGSEPALRDSLWVRNRSRVIPARFYARRPSGGRHEIVLLEEKEPGVWEALVRGQSAFKYPQKLTPERDPSMSFESSAPGVINFHGWEKPVIEFLEESGEMPLPPYIRERDPARDRDRYQTTWAAPDQAASVAAPTASLHFTPELCADMERSGVSFADIVLHVGLGTFEPVREPQLSRHQLHSERMEVAGTDLQKIRQAVEQKRPRVCVGTTALRTLESLSLFEEPARDGVDFKNSGIQEFSASRIAGRTRLFVRPGFEFRYVNSLFTNFHLPESTLLVLVATFCGSRQLALEAYRRAVTKGYRFFSFGDASLWI